MRFDMADLSLFRHVLEAGSITGGAERAHLALAAASTRIRNMEEALGAALLVRSRQGVTPTQAGRTLLQVDVDVRVLGQERAQRFREKLGERVGVAQDPDLAGGTARIGTEVLAQTLSLPQNDTSVL